MSASTINVKLSRSDNGTSWGFRMGGGKDFGAPFTLQRVSPGSVAEKGGLKVGDVITKIGTSSTEGLRHGEAQQLILESGNLVELMLERGCSVLIKTSEKENIVDSSQISVVSDVSNNQTTSLIQPTSSFHHVLPKPFTTSTNNNNISSKKAQIDCTSSTEVDTFSAPTEPPPLPSSIPPPLHPPSSSENFDEKHRYQGYVDPTCSLIKDSSKLTTIRSSSPDKSVSPSRKPAIGVKPNVGKDSAVGVKASKPTPPTKQPMPPTKQYNCPVGVHSTEKVTEEAIEDQTQATHQVHAGEEDVIVEVPVERKTIVIPSKKNVTVTTMSVSKEPDLAEETIDVPTERKTIVISSEKLLLKSSIDETDIPDSENSNGKKKYFLSETFQMIEDEESGRSEIQINPKTGKEMKINHSKKLMNLEKNFENEDEIIEVPTERKKIVLSINKKVQSSGSTVQSASNLSVSKQPQVPSGKGLVNVGKIGDAKKLPEIFEALKIPVCAECASPIRGPYVTALNKTWCPDHFICAKESCRRSLVESGFVEEDGRLYCERDYAEHFAPRCAKCGHAIVGVSVSALQQKFHTGCFVCYKCHLPITGGLFHVVEDGQICCEKDWSLSFKTKCYACKFTIDEGDLWVDALSSQWHSECFKCFTCQTNLDGECFYAKAGKPFCKRHGGDNN